jgi:ABC-type transport system involved in multi-copper enzyme maturation permease subunit
MRQLDAGGTRHLPLVLLGFNALLWVVVAALALAGLATPPVMTVAGLALLPQFALLGFLGPVRAVAWQTFRQCARMKLAGAFIALLALTLIVLPLGKSGKPLSDVTQSYLEDSIYWTAILLSVVTVFLAVGVVSGDVRTRQIFSVASKPLARWQYILGRWLGVVLLDALLLAVAAATIYGTAQYLRYRPAVSAADRRELESEVFAARERISPEPLPLEKAMEARVAEMRESGRFERLWKATLEETGGDEVAARDRIADQLAQEEATKLQSAAPTESLTWRFTGVGAARKPVSATARIAEFIENRQAVRLEASSSALALLARGGPVKVAGLGLRVLNVEEGQFWALIPPESASAAGAWRQGQRVDIEMYPILQFSYTIHPSNTPPSNVLHSIWEVTRPGTEGQREQARLLYRDDPVKIPSNLPISSQWVNNEGELVVRYFNRPTGDFRSSVTIKHQDVALLYRVGDFGPNFVRVMGLVLLQLAFLAALGVFAGSFLSFAVGCVLSFPMLVVGMASSFLREATDPEYASGAAKAFYQTSNWLVLAVGAVVPDFGQTVRATAIAQGMNVAWTTVGSSLFVVMGVQTVVMLVLAGLIFHRRELASVQV